MPKRVEVAFRDDSTKHGEEIVHNMDGACNQKQAFIWPEVEKRSKDVYRREPMVAKVDGIIAGRAWFEAELYPFAELENLFVSPVFRGKGIGNSIVVDAITRASELGYLAIHVQTDLNNTPAHNLYVKHGFLPAQQGEMIRMMRFINYPALSLFLARHPLALFDSQPAAGDENGSWKLTWKDSISEDQMVIMLSGGSCQRDSDGFAPGIAGFMIKSGDINLDVSITDSNEVHKDEIFDIELTMKNAGKDPITGWCRLLLNPEFEPGQGTSGAVEFIIEPSMSKILTLPTIVLDTFDDKCVMNSAYPSVPVCVEFCIGEYVFFLVKQVKVLLLPG